jgi:hypothetical protein
MSDVSVDLSDVLEAFAIHTYQRMLYWFWHIKPIFDESVQTILFWSDQSMCTDLRRRKQNVLATFVCLCSSFFLSFWDTYFYPRRGCPRALKLCMQASVTQNNKIAHLWYPLHPFSMICLRDSALIPLVLTATRQVCAHWEWGKPSVWVEFGWR